MNVVDMTTRRAVGNRPAIEGNATDGDGSGLRGAPWIVLALLGAALVLVEPSSETSSPRDRAETIRHVSAAVGDLEAVAARLAEERGLAYIALHAPEPQSAQQRAALAASRADVAGLLAAAIDRFEGAAGRGHLAAARVRDAWQHVVALRDAVDHALALPRSARDALLAERWFRRTSGLIEALHQGARYTQLHAYGDAALPRGLVAVQVEAWRLSEIIGRERALIGAAIASGQPMSDDERDELVVYLNRQASEWRRLERIVDGLPPAPELHEALATVRRAVFDELASARLRVLEASQRASAYPYSAEAWFAIASRSILATGGLQRSAAQLVERRVAASGGQFVALSTGIVDRSGRDAG